MIDIEEDTLLLEENPEVVIIQEHHVEGLIPTWTVVTADKKGSKVSLDSLPENPELYQGLLAEIMTDALGVGSLVILQNECP